MSVPEAIKALDCTDEDLLLWEKELEDAGYLKAAIDSDGTSVVYLGHPECDVAGVAVHHEAGCKEYRDNLKKWGLKRPLC